MFAAYYDDHRGRQMTAHCITFCDPTFSAKGFDLKH